MRQSQLFTKTLKNDPKDEESLNARLLLRGGFVNKLSAGIYSFLPLGLRVQNKIIGIIREEMNAIGGQEVLMPALIPADFWKKTNRWDTIDVLFRFKTEDEREYGLGASHEEVVTPLIKEYAPSYKDLPLIVYQFQTKFRNELRPKAGLLRGREFMMKDLYSFHTDQKDLDAFYEKAAIAYRSIYTRMGLGDITYLTYASGGDFARYSHEFQTITPSGEDLIYLCEKCKMAVNEELIAEQPTCPQCSSADLKTVKSIEVGNIFKLGERFSKAFDYYHTDRQGNKQPVLMGCYGIGVSRLIGAVTEAKGSETSILWPEEIAPYKVHLILMSGDEEAEKQAEELYEKLKKIGVEVLYDNRVEVSAGQKFAESDLIGCPYRLLLSAKSLAAGGVEVLKRSNNETSFLSSDKVLSLFS